MFIRKPCDREIDRKREKEIRSGRKIKREKKRKIR